LTIPERTPIAKKLKEHKRLVNVYGKVRTVSFDYDESKFILSGILHCTLMFIFEKEV